MDVSVVMIVRDGARFLPGAIESVLAQTCPPDEIMLIDGASTDETTQIAARYGVAIEQQPATGIADARNHGIARTNGELVAFLDCDDRWLPTKLERQSVLFDVPTQADYSVTMLLRRPAGAGIAIHPVFADHLASGPVRGLTPSTLVVRRSVVDRIGLFDGALGLGCDSDWFARASRLDLRRVDVDEVLVHKILHDANASIDVASTRRALLCTVRDAVRHQQRLHRDR